MEVVKRLDCQRIGQLSSEKEDQSFCSQGEHTAAMENCVRTQNNLHYIGAGI